MKSFSIDLRLRNETRLSAEEFLKALEEDKYNIAKARFEPSKLGSSSFGEFVVEWKNKPYRKIAYVR